LTANIAGVSIFPIEAQNIFKVLPFTPYMPKASDCTALLLPNSDCTIPVLFAPLMKRKYSTSLNLNYTRTIEKPLRSIVMGLKGEGIEQVPDVCYHYVDQDLFPETKVTATEVNPLHPGGNDFDNGVIVNGDPIIFPYLFGYKTPHPGDHLLTGAPIKYLYGTEINGPTVPREAKPKKYIQNGQVLVRFEFAAQNLENLDSFYAHLNVKKLVLKTEEHYQETELFCFVIKESRACSGVKYPQDHWQSFINQKFWNKSVQELSFDGSPVQITKSENPLDTELQSFSKLLRAKAELVGNEKEFYLEAVLDLADIFDRQIRSTSAQVIKTKSWQDLLSNGVYNMIIADDTRHASLPWLTIRTKEEVPCE
jgi:hypothetical protein